MLLEKTKEEHAFDFLSYVHARLLNKFYSNGLNPKINHKDIFQYFSALLRMDKTTTKEVLAMLEERSLISIQRAQGNGAFSVIVLRCKT